MKKIIIIFVTCLISNLAIINTQAIATENSIQAQVSDYCIKGDKILTRINLE